MSTPEQMSRRGFLATATTGAVAGALAPGSAGAQSPPPKTTKETLRPVVQSADLAITDQQLEKLAPAVEWSQGEMRKLREVPVGIGGPAPVYLPAAGLPAKAARP
ncbi:MAG TPA: twin-arginine translocation signal domain-containing protein [Candidatus Methylomirabilis sp.]|nr:twin-arginine translocation signal domain-containing protein [Candidatus Methylomirabilis sp.]